jgi:hypothetical protein
VVAVSTGPLVRGGAERAARDVVVVGSGLSVVALDVQVELVEGLLTLRSAAARLARGDVLLGASKLLVEHVRKRWVPARFEGALDGSAQELPTFDRILETLRSSQNFRGKETMKRRKSVKNTLLFTPVET